MTVPESESSTARQGLLLQARNLRKVFRNKVAVRNISLTVGPGSIVGLLGPNGAGKTTTFEMIAGFLRPTAGQVLLGEREITGLPVWKRVRSGLAYLPQEMALFEKLTVRENLLIILESFVRDRAERENQCQQLLTRLGLWELRQQTAGHLSGGEKRRLEIARSLINQPHFFLLDEPFSGIDPKTVSEIQDIVLTLKNDGIGILLTDHNVRDALRITDRAYLIYDGEILLEGTPREILEHPDSRKFYLGERFHL
ncbi:MAG TPA: LPS export ABC transporter ATP-binding protein [bacterium]|nr:LPS export ABC transporter ATP-binding protein [bacterium]HOL66252.1 LPS export ABC transporter ATP-binding protein [bacterium]HPP11389.1 LPS export ABC transporter ATP-binding protein [bacterium]